VGTFGADDLLSLSDDLRVQVVRHGNGRRSFVVLDVATGSVHARAERFLAPFGEGIRKERDILLSERNQLVRDRDGPRKTMPS
jgi:hypothetical protein